MTNIDIALDGDLRLRRKGIGVQTLSQNAQLQSAATAWRIGVQMWSGDSTSCQIILVFV